MKNRVLKSTIVHFVTVAEQRTARADELLVSNGQLHERAQSAETDRRLALELLGKCANIMPDCAARNEAVAFIKSRMAR